MLNSLWTMIVLFFELCSCKKFGRIQEKDTDTKQSCKTWHQKTYPQRSKTSECSKSSCKRCVITFGRILLFGFIFLLFSGNFVLGLLTIGYITGSISLSPIGVGRSVLYLSHHVPADSAGPGLDGKRDEAMFLYFHIILPRHHQIVLFDKESVITRRSGRTNTIMNRLYIGQFEELSHLKDGTLTKAIPCSRVFSFMDKVDATLFLWNHSTPIDLLWWYISKPLSGVDFSNCKLIFTFRYYPSNNDWNPFKDLMHRFDPYITIEWGIHIHNKSICPLTVRPLHIRQVLTSEVEDDLIRYTCSSACGDDANICDDAHSAHFDSNSAYGLLDFVTFLPDNVYFAINDLKVADSCHFITLYNVSLKFCDESWANVETVEVLVEIQQAYPHFITVPELYRFDEEKAFLVPRDICDQLWNSSQSCC